MTLTAPQAAPAFPPQLPELGMRAQLESLYAEREKLTEALGTCDADDVLALVDGLRAELAAARDEAASLRRVVELTEQRRRLEAERRALEAELEALRAAVGVEAGAA